MAAFGQTPWAQAQHYDWSNPGSNMATLPEAEIIKLLGLQQPQASTPAASPYAGAPAGAAPPQPVQRQPLPPPETEPTAPKPMKTAQAKRPDFSVQPQGSDYAGAFLQGLGGIAKPIGALISSQSGNQRATQSKNLTYDWLVNNGTDPTTAEMIVRNPDIMTSVLTAKFGGGDYGKTGAIMKGPDGKFYSVQFNARGQRRILPLETPGAEGAPGKPLEPAKGVQVVGDEVISSASGAPVRNVAPQIAGGEGAKVEGRELGELRSKLPTLRSRMQIYEDKAKRLDEAIDRAISRISGWTTGMGGALLSNMPGTDARALSGDLDTIRANVGFDELQAMRDASPTGGALGQVSEMENRLLQSLRAAIDQLQNGENLAQNLKIIKESNAQLREIQRQKLAADEARAAAGGTAPAKPGGWSIKRVD